MHPWHRLIPAAVEENLTAPESFSKTLVSACNLPA